MMIGKGKGRVILSLFLLTTVVLLTFSLTSCEKAQVQTYYKVVKVVDGDTIDVIYHGSWTSVRYIGIDTPETHAGDKPIGEYGEVAYLFNKELISQASSEVRLEFDDEKYDRYHRLLAYVYVDLATPVMLNAQLIKEGLAWPLTYFETSKHTKEFWKDYKYAYEHRLGMFSKYDSASVVKAKDVDENLSQYLGKLTWVNFHPVYYQKNSYEVTLSSTYFTVVVRTPELGEFATPLDTLYLNKDVEVYSEVWEKNGKAEMLLHAPFEFKVIP